MHLIVILLATVSVLTFLSGTIVFFGSTKSDRAKSAMYFLAAIFATVWMTSISLFLTTKPDSADNITWYVNGTFISAILLDVAFLGYGAWNKKIGKITTLVFLAIGLLISGAILINPESFYTEVTLSGAGNGVTMNMGPLYFSYIAFFAAIVPVIVFTFLRQFLNSRSKRKKGGELITMISFGLSSTLVLVFNLILPLFGNWSLIWVGPLALAVTILSVYYTILRYKTLNMSSIWLRIFSYVVTIASIAIVYMVVFSIVFAALFKGSTPSMEVIILNFIMILVFIVLTPAINGIMSYFHNLTTPQKKKDKNGSDAPKK